MVADAEVIEFELTNLPVVFQRVVDGLSTSRAAQPPRDALSVASGWVQSVKGGSIRDDAARSQLQRLGGRYVRQLVEVEARVVRLFAIQAAIESQCRRQDAAVLLAEINRLARTRLVGRAMSLLPKPEVLDQRLTQYWFEWTTYVPLFGPFGQGSVIAERFREACLIDHGLPPSTEWPEVSKLGLVELMAGYGSAVQTIHRAGWRDPDASLGYLGAFVGLIPTMDDAAPVREDQWNDDFVDDDDDFDEVDGDDDGRAVAVGIDAALDNSHLTKGGDEVVGATSFSRREQPSQSTIPTMANTSTEPNVPRTFETVRLRCPACGAVTEMRRLAQASDPGVVRCSNCGVRLRESHAGPASSSGDAVTDPTKQERNTNRAPSPDDPWIGVPAGSIAPDTWLHEMGQWHLVNSVQHVNDEVRIRCTDGYRCWLRAEATARCKMQ